MDIAKWVDHQYDDLGRTTGISDKEMVSLALLHIPEAAVPAYINARHRLKGDASVSADDCAPIIGWIKDEKRRLVKERREQHGLEPLPGLGEEVIHRLMSEHMPHLFSRYGLRRRPVL